MAHRYIKGLKCHIFFQMFAATFAIATLCSAQLTFPAAIISAWTEIKLSAVAITDSDCSGEIVGSLDSANAAFLEFGPSPQFVNALNNVRNVSGDVPEAKMFREQFTNITNTVLAFLETANIPKTTTAAPEQASSSSQEISAPTDAPKDYSYMGGSALISSSTKGGPALFLIVLTLLPILIV